METTQNELLEKESPDTLTTLPTSPTEPEKPDSLPRGSELNLITIRFLANEIESCQNLDEIREKVKAIKREAVNVLDRIEKRRLAKQQQAA
jgi:hypothetical protein